MAGSNVVLIGMMGSGKTTIGRVLAHKAGLEFIDTDVAIEEQADRTIAEIFASDGEGAFRAMETKLLEELQGCAHAVIATGGGIVQSATNRRLLHDLGTVFWLDAPPDTLLERIGDDESRPMLHGGDALKRLKDLSVRRREFYAEASDIHLDTEEMTPDEIVERIIDEMDRRTDGDWVDAADLFSTIVAIDGPVASGKSTLARRLARELNFTHVDTGAMYRCVALEARRRNADFSDRDALAHVASSVDIRFQTNPTAEAQRVLLNGDDVTDAIRMPDVSHDASLAADIPGVRKAMAEVQRESALKGRAVLEGRDIGTVVVPEAQWKLYVTASLEERTQRRWSEYKRRGIDMPEEQVREEIRARDKRDRNRPMGALKLATDATVIDTTDMPLDEVVKALATMIKPS